MSQQNFGTHKDLKKCLRLANKKGWDIRCDGSQHIRVTPPDSPHFTIPMSPGSKERVRAAVARFRRAGIQ